MCGKVGLENRSNRMAAYVGKNNVDFDGKSGIIKSLDIDDFKMMSEGKDIDSKAIDIISSVVERYEKSGDIFINDFYYGSLSSANEGTPLLQIEPIADGLIRLNVNTDVFGGRTIEEINDIIAKTKANVAQNLEEAVIHECGHARLIKGESVSEIERIYNELLDAHIEGISIVAYKDGVEAIAETEILVSRKAEIPKDALELYKKYIGGN